MHVTPRCDLELKSRSFKLEWTRKSKLNKYYRNAQFGIYHMYRAQGNPNVNVFTSLYIDVLVRDNK